MRHLGGALQVGGAVALTAGAGMWSLAAGFVVGGLLAFVLGVSIEAEADRKEP